MAGKVKSRIALLRLRKNLQVIAQAVVQRQAGRSAELVLSEEGICGRCLVDGRLSERLQVEFEVSAGNIGKVGEAVLAFGTVGE